MKPTEKWLVVAFAVGLLAAVLAPAFVTTKDSFPFSTYPMFTRPRPERAVFLSVRGVDARGQAEIVPMRWLGTDEAMQAISRLRRGVAQDRFGLCRRIAARAEGSGLSRIEIWRELHDIYAYYEGARAPLKERMVARCSVDG